MSKFEDERIERLVEYYRDNADELAALMADMVEEGAERRQAIYKHILLLLGILRKRAEEWSRETVRAIYEEADRQILDDMDDLGILDVDAFTGYQEQDVDGLIGLFMRDVDGALDSIQYSANRLKQGRVDPRFLGILGRKELVLGGLVGVAAVIAKSKMRKQLKDGLVRILTNNGKMYGYSLDYYVGMVADIIKAKARSKAAATRLVMNGQDLVRISPNPSTIGDYCDEFRGKVFSLSGTHPRYPSITVCPGNGPPPFHPHCHHWILPFIEGHDVDEFGEVDPEFLALSQDPTATPNDYQRLWLNRK